MKKLYCILFVILISLGCSAQTKWICKDLSACDWNKNTQEFDICKEYTGSSLFVVNDAETICEVTQPGGYATYFLKKSKTIPSTETLFAFDAISDEGKSYIIMFDGKELVVKISPENYSYVLMYKVTNITK